ncbi:MAG: aminotransferase class V-fold PLP-dependent enzyme [Pirellulales bacterium]
MPHDPLEPPPVDLDHNATTPIDPEVAELVRRIQLDTPGNPASQHAAGRRARKVLEDARERIGELLGCAQSDIRADRVIFTSGGTEANNLALFGLGCEPHRTSPPDDRVIISAIEHPSVIFAAERLRELETIVDVLPVDGHGIVRIEALRDALDQGPRPRLVSIMAANNETGVLQPITALAELCRATGVLFHTDAVQMAGKSPIAFHRWGVDALTIAAHKFHGPRGIGALVVRHGVPLAPQLFGGFQQAELRPGTESPRWPPAWPGRWNSI